MKTYFLITIISLIFILLTPMKMHSQGIQATEQNEEPYLLNEDGENFSDARGLFSRRKKASVDRATSVYLLVYPGPSGRIENMSAQDLARTGLQKELKFPSLYFTVSAASRLLIKSSAKSGKFSKEAISLTQLRQLGLKVNVIGCDRNKRPIKKIKASKFGSDPVITLATYPSDTVIGQSKTPRKAQNTFDRVDGIAQHLGPLGSIATSVTAVFRTFFPAKDHINQIAYMESETDFGWIWREGENAPIEGIHKCMVLLRAHKEVKYLWIKVEVITDWKRFGAWVKRYRYLIPVKGENDI